MTVTTTSKPFKKLMKWVTIGYAGLLILSYAILSTALIAPPARGNIDDARRFALELVTLNTTIGTALALVGLAVFLTIGTRSIWQGRATPTSLAAHTALLLGIFVAITAFLDLACVPTATQMAGFEA